MEHKRQRAQENNEENSDLSFIENLQATLMDMTDAEILAALELELNFIEEFQPFRHDYLEKLAMVMEIYTETKINLIFNFLNDD